MTNREVRARLIEEADRRLPTRWEQIRGALTPAAGEAAVRRRPRVCGAGYALLAAAACAAVAAVTVWGLMPVLNRDPYIVVPGATESAPADTAAPPAASPSETEPAATHRESSSAAVSTATTHTTPATGPLPADTRLVFNEGQMVSASRAVTPGYFTEEMTGAALAALFGGGYASLAQRYAMSGTAGFYNTGALDRAAITLTDKTGGRYTLYVGLDGMFIDTRIIAENPKVSDIDGTEVTAMYSRMEGVYYTVSFTLGKARYHIAHTGGEASRKELDALAERLIKAGEAAVDTVRCGEIPPWKYERPTLAEARADADFGQYVPQTMPAGYSLNDATRWQDYRTDYLDLSFYKGGDPLWIKINRLTDEERVRMADPAKRETYDMSRYPVPLADSVPAGLHAITQCPIFRSEQLTADLIRARALYGGDGKPTGDIAQFAVLYGDTIVEVNGRAVSAEDLYAMMKSVKG